MAAPSKLYLFNSALKGLGDGTFDLDVNTLKAQLHTSTYVPDLAADVVLADVNAEVANGNGYTTGGVTLTGVAFTEAAGVAKLDANNIEWTGAGAGFSARFVIVYASGTLNGKVNPLIGYLLLDSAPADVQFAVGNKITVEWDVSGLFNIQRAA